MSDCSSSVSSGSDSGVDDNPGVPHDVGSEAVVEADVSEEPAPRRGEHFVQPDSELARHRATSAPKATQFIAIETYYTYCHCGTNGGIFYALRREQASRPAGYANDAMQTFATTRGLQLCCRTMISAPMRRFLISSDVEAVSVNPTVRHLVTPTQWSSWVPSSSFCGTVHVLPDPEALPAE